MRRSDRLPVSNVRNDFIYPPQRKTPAQPITPLCSSPNLYNPITYQEQQPTPYVPNRQIRFETPSPVYSPQQNYGVRFQPSPQPSPPQPPPDQRPVPPVIPNVDDRVNRLLLLARSFGLNVEIRVINEIVPEKLPVQRKGNPSTRSIEVGSQNIMRAKQIQQERGIPYKQAMSIAGEEYRQLNGTVRSKTRTKKK